MMGRMRWKLSIGDSYPLCDSWPGSVKMVRDPLLVMLSPRNVSAPKISGVVRADSNREDPHKYLT